MKIAVDGRVLMDVRQSGVSAYTQNLLDALLDIDRQNQYLLFYNTHRRPAAYPAIAARFEHFRRRGVKIVARRWPNKILNYLLLWPFAWPKLDHLLGEQVDLWWQPHLNFSALSRRLKNILTIHDLSFLRYPEFFSWSRNLWHRFIRSCVLANKADRVVAISENTKRDIRELTGVSEEKISVIYSGITADFKPFNKDDESLAAVKNKYQLPDKFILYLGTIEPRKNLVGLIAGYNWLRQNYPALAEVKLIITGGNGWKFKEVYAAAAASPFRNDIKFLGYVSAADKPALYNLAGVFAFVSFYEGFGFPPLEAMACGVPVVASFTSSMPEVIGEAGVLVDPYNAADIGEVLAQVLLDENLAQDLRARGLAQAKKFSWRQTAEKYLTIFNESL